MTHRGKATGSTGGLQGDAGRELADPSGTPAPEIPDPSGSQESRAADPSPGRISPVVIAILNYNGRDLLAATIESARQMDYPGKQLLVVDDGSTDGSVEFLRRYYPDLQVVEMGSNTKMLNRVRNTALERAGTDHVFLTDNDITFAPDCLTRLMSAARERADAAVLVPRVMYRHEPDRIYIDRNQFHYVCSSIDRNRNRRLDEIPEAGTGMARTFGCGIMLIDRRKARQVGYFDADYPMGWGDDGEFHHRLNLAGMPCYAVPEARVYHEAIKGTPRVYGQIHNRLALILQTYSARSLLVLAPALCLYDLSLFLFLLLKGQPGAYLRAVRDIARQRRSLWRKRRRVQALRRRRDRELFTTGDLYVPAAYRRAGAAGAALGLLNRVLDSYWWLCRRFL